LTTPSHAPAKRSTVHDTFVITRTFAFPPELVFSAWSSAQAKSRWFAGPTGWETQRRVLDFRVGGEEQVIGRKPDGGVSTFTAHYYDIVPNERIVYAYEMYIDGTRISVSAATVEFKEQKGNCQLVVTEQGVFLDDFDDARGREHGTRILMDQLESSLVTQAAG
jgi:uncharacterized protein YndB with AHSA1/START domain